MNVQWSAFLSQNQSETMNADKKQFDIFMGENHEKLFNKDSEDFEKAVKLLKNMSDGGNINATIYLISLYRLFSLEKNEIQTYLDRIRKAYDQNPEIFDEGMLCNIGSSIERCGPLTYNSTNREDNLREALKWAMRWFSRGDINSVYSILNIYKQLPDNNDDAFQWCVWGLSRDEVERMDAGGSMVIDPSISHVRRMAEIGHPPSQYRLGMMYLKGDIVKRSDDRAKEWFSRSAEGGYGRAITAMKEYEKDGNFLALVMREYLHPDDYGVEDMPEYLEERS